MAKPKTVPKKKTTNRKKATFPKKEASTPRAAVRRATRRQPKPPFPEQDIEPPGLEAKMDPRPKFEAPAYRGSGKLLGQVALVTGGDSGIGRAVTVLFAREGANVAIVHLPKEQVDADETVAAVEKEGAKAISIPGDVTNPKFCQKAVEQR